jgi:Zn-dependent peptidase ImmA (M78 family)
MSDTPAGHAARLLAKYAPEGPVVPVEQIAASEGIEVIPKPHDGIEASFALQSGGRKIIGINSRTGRQRRHVACGHALGHMIMHSRPIIVCCTVRLGERKDIQATGSDQEEAEAHAFAAGLLMPAAAVLAVIDELAAAIDGRAAAFPRAELVDAVARRFCVSRDFAFFRLGGLGILGT